jgi:excisionase family DNA binding protein
MTEWLSVKEYAEIYRVTRPTVYKWRDCGLLRTFQIGRVVRIYNAPPEPTRSQPVSTTEKTLSR